MHWKVTFTIKDAKQRIGKLLLYYRYDDVGNSEFPAPYSLGVVEMTTFTGYVLDQMIKGQIIGINVSLDADLPAGIKLSPLDDSDVEEGAIFRYPTNSTGKPYFEHRIPTFDESLMPEGGKMSWLTPGVPAIVGTWVSYVTQPEDTELEALPGAITQRGVDIKSFFQAWESFIKSGKRK
jgi:hypothetical protein